jgi:uncharacterized protein (TIGR03437 family)
VTPGKIVVLYGSRLGPDTLTGASIGGDGRVAGNTGGTQVLFDGVPAPILYTSAAQVAAVVPYEVDGKLGTQVQVRNGTQSSDLVALPVFAAAPSIFSVDLSGTGQAAILNQDGLTVNSAKSPAARGSFISIYATGEGQTQPGGVDGQVSAGSSLPAPTRPVTVFIDGKPAEVQYAGAAPNAVAGLFQVNVRIPGDAAPGDAALEIHVGTAVSQPGMTVAVK